LERSKRTERFDSPGWLKAIVCSYKHQEFFEARLLRMVLPRWWFGYMGMVVAKKPVAT
jgi:hypothetical protein